MSDLKKLPKSLPQQNPLFEIEVEGETTKENYTGRFETKIPNLSDQVKISKIKALLSGGLVLDPNSQNIVHMAAYSQICIVKCPKWFEESNFGIDLFDKNVLEVVYNNIIEKEDEWLKGVWGSEES